MLEIVTYNVLPITLVFLTNNVFAITVTSPKLYQGGEENADPSIEYLSSNSKANFHLTKSIRKRQIIEEIANEPYPDEIFFENYTGYANYSDIVQEYIDNYTVPKTWTWVLIIFHCMVFIIGLLGNILVCVAVYKNHSMRTVTNYFIVNLALADALVILFCLPFSVVWDVTSTWWFGTVMCKIVLYFQSVSVTVSILTLAFISIDRWYAICFPLKFKSTTGKAVRAICVIWIIALACEIPETIALRAKPFSKKYTYFTQCAPTWHAKTDMLFMTVKMGLFYWSPLFLMSIAYIQIIKILWKSGRASHQNVDVQNSSFNTDQSVNFAINTNKSTEYQLRSRRKVAKMLVAVVSTFAICYLPVHLLSILSLAIKLENSDFNRAMVLISHWLCYANSALNPIIYNFMSGKFRQEFKSAFSKFSQANGYSFGRSSSYIYRFSTTNRHSVRSQKEMVKLRSIK